MRRFLGLQSTGAGTGWQFENLLCTEAAVTTLAVGGRLFSLRNIVLSAMVWWFASGFGWMRRLGASAQWGAREQWGWHKRIPAFTAYRCRYGFGNTECEILIYALDHTQVVACISRSFCSNTLCFIAVKCRF